MTTVLLLTNFFKGHRLLESFKALGCRTLLVGTARVRHDAWACEHVDEKFFVHDFQEEPALLNAITYLARDREIDLVVPLEEYAVETASKVRAHLGLPGPDEGITRRARDKLAMRLTARAAGIPVPEFSAFVNRAAVASFLERVPGPWMVKPRMEGGSVQIRKLRHADEVWQCFEELGDRRSYHLIESFVPGQVYHVDSVVHAGKVLMALPGQYGAPPFDVWHGGGVFSSRTVAGDHPLFATLLDLNEKVISAVGVQQGVNHVEFLGLGDRAYFLEIGARVAGSNLDRLTTAATGIDLFLESARLDLDWLQGGRYALPKTFRKEAGIVLCLSRDKSPCDTFCCDYPEVVWTLSKDHHAGCVVASPSSDRIEELVGAIRGNLERDHLAVMPATDTPR
jgi:biotin carboxylase